MVFHFVSELSKKKKTAKLARTALFALREGSKLLYVYPIYHLLLVQGMMSSRYHTGLICFSLEANYKLTFPTDNMCLDVLHFCYYWTFKI